MDLRMWPWWIEVTPSCQWRGELIPAFTPRGLFLATFIQLLPAMSFPSWCWLSALDSPSLGSLLTKARQKPGCGATEVQGRNQGELVGGPAEWHPHMDENIMQVCKMHLSRLKALYTCRMVLVWGLFPLKVSSECPFWRKVISCFRCHWHQIEFIAI